MVISVDCTALYTQCNYNVSSHDDTIPPSNHGSMSAEGRLQIRHFHFQSSKGWVLTPIIAEYYSISDCIFTWPCALVLSCYLLSTCGIYTEGDQSITNDKTKSSMSICQGKHILELGSGTGLASVVAGHLNAKSCVMTDRSKEECAVVHQLMNYNIALNKLQTVIHTVNMLLVLYMYSNLYEYMYSNLYEYDIYV